MHASWAIGAVVAQLLYTQWVGGSNPSSPTNLLLMKTRILCGEFLIASALYLVAQSEQVKGKAKDLKRKIEAQQTNSAGGATNAPAKSK